MSANWQWPELKYPAEVEYSGNEMNRRSGYNPEMLPKRQQCSFECSLSSNEIISLDYHKDQSQSVVYLNWCAWLFVAPRPQPNISWASSRLRAYVATSLLWTWSLKAFRAGWAGWAELWAITAGEVVMQKVSYKSGIQRDGNRQQSNPAWTASFDC